MISVGGLKHWSSSHWDGLSLFSLKRRFVSVSWGMVESVFREAYIFQPATKWTVKNVSWQWFTFIIHYFWYKFLSKKRFTLRYTYSPIFFSSRAYAILSIDNKNNNNNNLYKFRYDQQSWRFTNFNLNKYIYIYIFREDNKISCGRKINKKGLLIK